MHHCWNSLECKEQAECWDNKVMSPYSCSWNLKEVTHQSASSKTWNGWWWRESPNMRTHQSQRLLNTTNTQLCCDGLQVHYQCMMRLELWLWSIQTESDNFQRSKDGKLQDYRDVLWLCRYTFKSSTQAWQITEDGNDNCNLNGMWTSWEACGPPASQNSCSVLRPSMLKLICTSALNSTSIFARNT